MLVSVAEQEENHQSMAERKLFVVPVYCPEAVHEYFSYPPGSTGLDLLRSKVRGHLSAMGWKYWYAKKGGGGKEELRYRAPDGKDYCSLRMACQGCIQREVPESIKKQVKSESEGSCCVSESEPAVTVSSSTYGNQRRPPKRARCSVPDSCIDSKNNKRRKTVRDQNKKAEQEDQRRARQAVAKLDPEYCTPHNALSWLVSKDVVLPRTNVYYRREFNCRNIGRGKVTRAGIKCDCCSKVYGITSFEDHVTGSSSGRAAAHIFLEDGKSLLECQKQSLRERMTKETQLEINRKAVPIDSDEICSVCHNGGTLLLCDDCPSAFHLSCIGLEELPEGNWFCPSCSCSVCGNKESYNGETGINLVHCNQCERGFHLECLCLRDAELSKGKWFCSGVCEKLHTSLEELSGKSTKVVGAGNLRCSVLKFTKGIDDDALAEHHLKLNLALSVMHECFESIKEEHSRDLVEDVLFSRRSKLKRLDFGGYCTFLLEKEDEVVSVATVRVFGGKVAEVPFVATRPQYRQQGMCHILMAFVEKTLKELGVERLLLASIPQMLQSWTSSSFGFSKMPDSERKKFLNYILLDFQGTTMCQKILRVAPRIKIIGPRAPPSGEDKVAAQIALYLPVEHEYHFCKT